MDTNESQPKDPLGRLIRMFERAVVVVLVALMIVVVALATLELGWVIVQDVLTPPVFLLEIGELLEIFGSFLLVLIGVELLETIKSYLRDNVVHVAIVLEVALIAVARKVIVLDVARYGSLDVLATAALVLALAASAYVERRMRGRGGAAGAEHHRR